MRPSRKASRPLRLNKILSNWNLEKETCRLKLHITSMVGTWMSNVEGFGGMRVIDNKLSFVPKIPEQWEAYSFKINFRNQVLKISVSKNETKFEVEGGQSINILMNGKAMTITS